MWQAALYVAPTTASVIALVFLRKSVLSALFPPVAGPKATVEEVAESLRERRFGVWALVILVGIAGTLPRIARWRGPVSPVFYFCLTLSFSILGAVFFVLWRLKYVTRHCAARCYCVALVASMILGSAFSGAAAAEVFSLHYALPTMMLVCYQLSESFRFICVLTAVAFLVLILFTSGFYFPVTLVCVSCLQEDSRLSPFAVTFLTLGMFLYQRRDAAFILHRTVAFRDSFLAAVSHEFKTPLNGISGSVALLEGGKNLTADQVVSVGVISRCTALLKLLVENVMMQTSSSLTESAMSVVRVKTDDLLERSMRILGMIDPEASIRLQVASNVPKEVRLNEQAFLQVFLNYGSNAIKFSPSGRPIDIALDLDDAQQLRLQVSDRGHGVSAAFEDKLFSAYARERRSVVEGTGLGLSICANVLERMGGTYGYEQRQGGGSTFLATFPLDSDAAASRKGSSRLFNSATSVATEEDELLTQKTVTVLICEDNAVNAAVLRRLLVKKVGLSDESISVATDGAQGLEWLMARSRQSATPQDVLCFVDLTMPVLGGREMVTVFSHFLQLSSVADDHFNVRFVATTAETFSDDNKNLFDAIINKPVSVKQLKDLFD